MGEARPVEEQVTHRVDGGVAWITLNEPEAGNSITPAMRDRLGDLFEDASADPAVRAVVLTGAGDRHFCTGANLGGERPAPPRPEGAPERLMGDVARMIRRGWQRVIGAMLDCEKPVLGSVNGTAAGGGAHLVLACDLVLMADSARLIEVFVRRGIMPDAGGAYLLPRLVGPQRAKELMFFGDAVSADDALRLGLANRVVPAAELAATTAEWAERLAASPTKAIALTKWLVNRSFESNRITAFEEEAVAVEMLNRTDDAQEGVRSFVERRSPDFRGW
jgi:2-(1,2-epoxy-1,2-dihydrophenyl)acetyl-CoA isomerase